MAQQFTRNHRDHSNDTGYQFEFFCDKCGSGYRSSFKTNKLGVAANILKAAGSIFGGALGRAGYGADHVKDALRGSGWDDAFKEAIDEIKPKFHQCSRCGKWVCPEICWNASRELCEDCAPDLQESAAAVQAQVAVEQIGEKARKHDQTGGIDMSQPQASGAGPAGAAACGKCKARMSPGAKFCPECGQKAAAPPGAGAQKSFCSECGAKLDGAKFCPECGTAAGG